MEHSDLESNEPQKSSFPEASVLNRIVLCVLLTSPRPTVSGLAQFYTSSNSLHAVACTLSPRITELVLILFLWMRVGYPKVWPIDPLV